MEYKDYYKTLNVEKTATPEEIKRAYRRMARKYHPDVSKESNAEEKFKEAKEAYEVLSDAEKKQAYDQLGSNWQSGQGFTPPPDWEGQAQGFSHSGQQQNFSDFSDFFSELFGGGARHAHQQQTRARPGENIRSKLTVTLEEAFHGGVRHLTLQMPELMSTGQMRTTEKTLRVKIPAGVTSGQQIRLAGQGGPGFQGGPNGDLYLEIQLQDHAQYILKGRDIYLVLPVTPWEAALGATISVPTLAGSVDLKIPSNSQSGQKLRLKGRGLPGEAPGNQYVELSLKTPPADTEEKRAFYQKMADTMPFNPRERGA